MENRTITGLYMGWRESHPDLPQQWLPVMYATWDESKQNHYHSYTRGFEANYERLKGMIYNPDMGYTKLWQMKQIDPTFSNRVPKREDTLYIYDLLDIPEAYGNTVTYLARCLGKTNNSDFDFFPRIEPNRDGEYEFYFLILGLADMVKDGVSEVKKFADTTTDKLELDYKIGKDKTKLFVKDLHIGYCPDYIHFFLTKCPVNTIRFTIAKVNHNDTYYGGRFLIGCQIKTNSNTELYSHSFLQPLNSLTNSSVVRGLR